MSIINIRNPIAELVEQTIEPARRSSDLNGKRIGLYWNMKGGGDVALTPRGTPKKALSELTVYPLPGNRGLHHAPLHPRRRKPNCQGGGRHRWHHQ